MMQTYKTRLMVGLASAALASGAANAQDGPHASATAPEGAPSNPGDLTGMNNDIIVTAGRREQRLQDTAGSITAISGSYLEQMHDTGMEDYLRTIPGVISQDQGAGYSSVVIRGVSTSPDVSSPVAGLFFGETAIQGHGIDSNNADIKLIDVNHVEVLTGPQGTLFGAASMSGAVRTIPNDADTSANYGHVQSSGSWTGGYGGANLDLEGVANLVVAPGKLAIRLVGYRLDESGYYKNISGLSADSRAQANQYGVLAPYRTEGATVTSGGRLAMAWRPDSSVRVDGLILHQFSRQTGFGSTDIGVGGPYDQDRFGIRLGDSNASSGPPVTDDGARDRVTLANLRLNKDLGFANLLVTGSYFKETALQLRDGSVFFQPRTPWSQNFHYYGKTIIQEIRLTSEGTSRFQYIIGGYHSYDSGGANHYNFFGAQLGIPASDTPTDDDVLGHSTTDLLAGYGEVSYRPIKMVKLTGGFRFTHQSRNDDVDDVIFNGVDQGNIPLRASSNNKIGKAQLEVTPTRDLTAYALWSQGFRLGDVRAGLSPNDAAKCDLDGNGFYDSLPGVPTSTSALKSDTLNNYELGVKSKLFGGRLVANASVYRMDWKNIPVNVFPPCLEGAITVNAGNARIQGAELALILNVDKRLTLSLSSGFNDPKLRSADTSLGSLGAPGSRLPGSSKYTITAGADYRFSAFGGAIYVSGRYSYIGGYFQDIAETRPELGNFGQGDITATYEMGQYSVSAYIHNIGNSDGLTALNTIFSTDSPDIRAIRVRPRTVGLSLRFSY